MDILQEKADNSRPEMLFLDGPTGKVSPWLAGGNLDFRSIPTTL